ncbi:MAG: T9SS type A sorting domain-containing protein [Paramuribaculum sp.]|nr:T9SS type A sorting domain-containing protein [Paramuribaculum sp.]
MKKFLLFTSVLAVAGSMSAQELKEGYITWPSSSSLASYIQQWNGGNGTIQIDGKAWEDQEFFTSRVKPKARVYNTLTQVNPSLTQYNYTDKTGTDKRLIFWVPVGDEKRNGVQTNALPNGIFDGEMFSSWSYVDHYGNWNAPYGWTPGNFADVAHKNGVAVSGVASVAFGSISAEWSNQFNAMSALDANTVGKFLYYFGQDGLGYNSEWTGYAPHSGLTTLHNGLKSYMADKDPLWEVIWYAGTTDNGGRAFDAGVGSGGGNTQLFKGASMFLNYNWNNTSKMATSIQHAKDSNLNPFHIYAGMNMQGGEPKGGDNYPILKDYQYSIGLWGAHSNNMLWLNRNSNGSSAKAMQRTYLEQSEAWFTNAVHNPAVPLTIKTNRNHAPKPDWAGISSMMSARSAISGNIADEPFYSYFNLGNGLFMNWKGVRENEKQWHNIGVQDYMPTWRWWFAPEFLGRNLTEESFNLSAGFVWDDAYMGGSCMQISGTSDKEYLHLFKTHLKTAKGQRIRFIYKLLEGEGKVELLFTDATKNNKAENVSEKNSWNLVAVNPGKNETWDDIIDKSYDGWQVYENTINTAGYNKIASGDAYIDMISLRITGAKNMKLLVGGLEILPAADMAAPAAPVVTLTKILANNFSGVDGKIIWKMNNSNPVGAPVYNSDVNTAIYRVWSQQEGEEPVMSGMTTSWASFVFSAPVNPEGSQKIRFGVSAVSSDMSNESAISWGAYQSMGEYEVNNDIELSKQIIKPNEEFSIKFKDPKHESGTWVITDAQTDVEQWNGSGKEVTCPGLAEIGAYTLKITCNGVETEYPRYISISSEAVGALPEIYTLSVDGDVVESEDEVTINVNEGKTFSYTARPADGSASRGIELNEKWFGVQVGQLGIGGTQSFSVAAWVKYNSLPQGLSNFITIEDRINGGWPYNNWGFFWSRIDENGRFCPRKIDTAWGHRTGSGTEGQRLYYKYADSKIDVNAWTHVALVWEFNAQGQMRQKFYINGKQQLITAWCTILKSTAEGTLGSTAGYWDELERLCNDSKAGAGNWGLNTYEPGFVNQNRPLSTADWIAFGGSASDITAVEGCVDDFQVWGKAMTAEDVALSMAGLDGNNLPADVLGYWDFETDCNASTFEFVGATGTNASNKAPKAYWYELVQGTAEGSAERFDYGRPVYGAGCPYISGTAYPVVTTPTWESRRAVINGSGNSTEGSANIEFPKEGEYTVTLTLENGHGSDSKDYPVIKVKDMSAINSVAGDNEEGMSTYVVDDIMFLEFAADGNYTIDVYNVSGVQVAKKAASLVAGQTVQIALNTPGVYLVKVMNDGKELRTVKVIRN